MLTRFRKHASVSVFVGILELMLLMMVVPIGIGLGSISCQPINQNPAVQAASATTQADADTVASLKAQLAAAKAATQPSQSQIDSLTAQLSTAIAKQTKDWTALTDAQKTAVISAVQQAINSGTLIAAPVVGGTPWGDIAIGVLGVVSAVLGVFTVKQTNAATTAKNVIAAAAPGVAQLVQQTTDGKIKASDVTSIGQVSQGVLDLLSHDSATQATAGMSAAAPIIAAVQAQETAAGTPTAFRSGAAPALDSTISPTGTGIAVNPTVSQSGIGVSSTPPVVPPVPAAVVTPIAPVQSK